MLGKPLEVAGVIILIISGASAYAKMIQRTGLGTAVHDLVSGQSVDFVLLDWVLAAVMRLPQGSAAVSVVGAIGIVVPIAVSAGTFVHLPCFFWRLATARNLCLG